MTNQNKIRVLFIGGYYPKALENLFFKKTKTGLDFAAHNLQEAIFKGFDQNKLNYQILNAPFLDHFRRIINYYLFQNIVLKTKKQRASHM